MDIIKNAGDENNIKELVKYFKSGCKKEKSEMLGLELEHFIVHRDTKEAVSYYGEKGVRYVASELMKLYEEAVPFIYHGAFIGFQCAHFNITMEPAAQLEISIEPREEIGSIRKIYHDFRQKLDRILMGLNYEAVTFGYQPKSMVESLKIIPKDRYDMMDKHFESIGSGGREMMRGTASTQISIDYFSEDDFRRKIQAIYILSPILKLITDNTPFFEGKPSDGYLKRTDIWNRVDPVRTGIISGVLKEDYGFKDYAMYLWNLPLICYADEKGCLIEGNGSSAHDIYGSSIINRKQCEHIMSMAFPDVRLKNYLEIRIADSMAEEDVMNYAKIIKGIFYNDDVLCRIERFIRDNGISEADIKKGEREIMSKGPDAYIYGRPVRELMDEVLKAAE